MRSTLPPGLPRRTFLAAVLAALAAPEPVMAAANLRAAGNGARVVLPGAAARQWRLSAMARPARLVLRLPRHRWEGPTLIRGAGPVVSLRWDARASQVVMDLSGPVAEPSVSREGGALVLSIRPGPAAAFARMAGPNRPIATGHGAPRPVVVLDPGHGGKDPGAIGATGTQEKRVVLAAAQEMKRRLEAGGRCRVMMTRTRDVFVPLGKRVDFARRNKGAIFVSIHADSAPGARGASVYTLSETASDTLSAALARRENAADAAGGLNLPPVPPDVQRILLSLVRQETRQGSVRLANMTVSALRPRVPLLPNTHRQAAFAVLKAPDIPSLLVEIGFLSSRQDEAQLKRPQYRAVVAAALASAVEDYLERPGVGVASFG
ncbi:N-acetylmuramoyl-L-alanine amidase family protein [Roseomonas xinghualingensis]|uniref:N-acetylmuramoyl-L-alanine amidase family protein n=1 Tax=Roseomonas xinghualingensis TaxID=2986475 RepID=UPI0021F13D8A|nr:N-acetylmuramoyl-L-alanine amidase [Roseomonas sp. SXEYE001]MCV4207845.1 N-acetylmuramoyl-L-alanine amidase [Roseomonas sp. SXEYE001]